MIEDVLTRAASELHEAWLKAGRSGDGRLVRHELRFTDLAVAGRLLTASRFVRCVFSSSVLRSAHLQEAEFANLQGAHFEDSDLSDALLPADHGATLLRCKR